MLRKGLVFYIIKQGLNEPPRWWTLYVLEKVATKGTMSMAITLCCAPNEIHLGNLEIEHVLQLWLSCATTCYYGSGLVNYIRKTHTLSLVTGHGDLECFMGAEDKLAMMYGRTFWKDFVTFSVCQYSILVSTNPVGHWWQQDGIVSCG